MQPVPTRLALEFRLWLLWVSRQSASPARGCQIEMAPPSHREVLESGCLELCWPGRAWMKPDLGQAKHALPGPAEQTLLPARLESCFPGATSSSLSLLC